MEEQSKLRKYDIIGIGIFLSLIAFGILFWIKYYQPTILDIDAKWLLIASSPVLISLVLSGIIKSFKGVGIELEFELNSQIGVFEGLFLRIEPQPVNITDKGDVQDLWNFSESILTNTTVLQFRKSGNGTYYTREAIWTYVARMPNLKYLLVVDNTNKFQFIINFQEFKKGFTQLSSETPLFRNLAYFLNGESELGNVFPFKISEYILLDKSILEVYDKANDVSANFIPVLDAKKHFIGIIEKEKLYKTIAERAIQELKRKNR